MESYKTTYSLYLSLGSNIGNRFAKLQLAIDKLFRKLGSILKISSVYETPAMGFEGQPFLNCAVLLYTEMDPQFILSTIFEIEKDLGRDRQNSQGYSSRTIDIDILFIDDQIINKEDLIVPHPRLQARKFVLKPLEDLDSTIIHPIFKKTIKELLLETTDDSYISMLDASLKNPVLHFNIPQYNYIAIEGNIGAGKTSLATKIAADFNAKLILERYKDNPFLPKFYEDADRYAFPLEMSFLADRYQQLVEDITQFDLFKELVIADYDVNKSLIFAGITLPEEEFNLYKKLFQVMHKDLPKPDLYVYLYQNTDRLLQNIKKRGRSYEKSIPEEYLRRLNSGYMEFIKSQPPKNIKLIDITEMDFICNRQDYLSILEIISN